MKAHAAPVTRDCILRLRAPNLNRWGPAESAAIWHSSQGAVTQPLASGACALLTVRWSRQPSMCGRRVMRPPWPACVDRDDHVAVHTSWWRFVGLHTLPFPANSEQHVHPAQQRGLIHCSGCLSKGFPIRLGTTGRLQGASLLPLGLPVWAVHTTAHTRLSEIMAADSALRNARVCTWHCVCAHLN